MRKRNGALFFQIPGWAQRAGMAQKGTTMFKRYTHPLLKDFPWLWAVKQEWRHETGYRVQDISPEYDNRIILCEPEACYFHCRAFGEESVVPFADRIPNRMMSLYGLLGHIELNGPVNLHLIEHIAILNNEKNTITIYRAKKYGFFHVLHGVIQR